MENTSTTTATDFGMNCMAIIICRVWSFRRKKSTPSASGAGNTSSILREYRPILYSNLVLSGRLYSYLADIDTQARNKLSLIATQLAEKESITEELKALDQMAWVRAMNNIRNRAEEIVLKELIYGEDA